MDVGAAGRVAVATFESEENMPDNVMKPMQSARQFFQRAAGEAIKQAVEIDPPEGGLQAIRDAVETEAVSLLRSSIKRELGEAGRMAKSMSKLHGRTLKEISKGQKHLHKAEQMAAAYRDDSRLGDKRKAAARELHELNVRSGRAGQAAHEWGSWASQLEALIPDVESAVAQAKPTRPTVQDGQAIMVSGSGYHQTPP